MEDMNVPNLVLRGIATMSQLNFFDNERLHKTILATERAVGRMSGVMVSICQEFDDIHSTTREHVNILPVAELRSRKEKTREILRKLPREPPKQLQEQILQLSITIQTLLANTSTETLSLQVRRVRREDDEDEEDCIETYVSQSNAIFLQGQSIEDNIKELLALERVEDLCLFSNVNHETDDALTVQIDAWAPMEKELPRLVEATGALFKFCQILCDSIADPRGVYVTTCEDGDIVRSRTAINSNSCKIILAYDWKSPSQIGDFGRVVRAASRGSRDAATEISKALEQKGHTQKTKNVYLVGQTGEGKSTLANKFTGTNRFRVSVVGSGTYDISGELVQQGGALDKCDDVSSSDAQIMVWDTPGMNDQDGLDQMFENKLYGHLTREQTVSTILIVSKDGCRFPGTLKKMLEIYQKAFGESLLSCIAVLIGIRLEDTERGDIKQKKRFWVTQISKELGHTLSKDKVFFYNALSSKPQAELERLKTMIFESSAKLTGTGSEIYQGILDLRSQTNQLMKEETKYKLRLASKEISRALEEEVQAKPRIKLKYGGGENAELLLLPSRLAMVQKALALPNGTIKDTYITATAAGMLHCKLRMREMEEEEDDSKKIIMFSCSGEKARTVLENVCRTGGKDKDRFNALMRQAERERLILTKMESATLVQRNRKRIPIHTYMFVDVDHTLNGTIYNRIRTIIEGLVGDRYIAEPIMDHMRESRVSSVSSS